MQNVTYLHTFTDISGHCCLCSDGNSRVTFEQLLQFVSGADEIPILGYDTEPTLDFYTPVANVRRLPCASTCDIRLFLPRGASVEELSSMLEESILECSGFGFI